MTEDPALREHSNLLAALIYGNPDERSTEAAVPPPAPNPSPSDDRDRLRREIAAAHGLDSAMAVRLNGATADELAADAARLAREFPAAVRHERPSSRNDHADWLGRLLAGERPRHRDSTWLERDEPRQS